MLTCPHCHDEVQLRLLPHPKVWKNYRECPHCGRYFTVDAMTRRRQAVFIGLAAVALVLTILVEIRGLAWAAPAAVSYALLGLSIYLGNKRVLLVPYRDKQG